MGGQPLDIRQGQMLAMTQQLRQSISLLQLSTAELDTVIDIELEKNPLLRREGEDDYEVSNQTHDAQPEVYEAEGVVSRDGAAEKLDMENDTVWGVDSARMKDHDGALIAARGISAMTDDIEQCIAGGKTLHEHLRDQIRMMLHDTIELKLAELVIDMVDPAGYLPADISHIADQIGCEQNVLERIITSIQQCEPTGVGAQSLQECLALQLNERGLLDDTMKLLLEHLEWVGAGNQKRLCKLCDLEPDALMHRIAQLRACNPKPGCEFESSHAATLIPEVLVRKSIRGDWIVELNQDILPKVLIDRVYSNRLSANVRHKDESKAIHKHVSNANWLVRALHQRNTTLLAVATEIVKQQSDFFEFGIQFLKPLTLRDIACVVECHESTVSRITTSKFLACERGTFELKYFFNSTLVNANGGAAYSSKTVMHLIKKIIEAEKPSAVLSDDAITDALNRQGIDVARRTVVKYRKQMGIPSSIQRRRQKW